MNAQMTKEAGSQYVYSNVHVPVFFDRLASRWGIVASNTAEAQIMLKTAAQLLTIQEHETQKQQETGNTLLQKAAAHVDQVVSKLQAAVDHTEQQIAATAKAAAVNPEMVAAFTALQQ